MHRAPTPQICFSSGWGERHRHQARRDWGGRGQGLRPRERGLETQEGVESPPLGRASLCAAVSASHFGKVLPQGDFPLMGFSSEGREREMSRGEYIQSHWPQMFPCNRGWTESGLLVCLGPSDLQRLPLNTWGSSCCGCWAFPGRWLPWEVSSHL